MITDYENVCFLCNRRKEHTHHLVFGNASRTLADHDGLTAPVCQECHQMIHQTGLGEHMSKIVGQLAYEKDKVARGYSEEEARESFRQRYGRSFL